jgi:large conductance mechanosensitive channel
MSKKKEKKPKLPKVTEEVRQAKKKASKVVSEFKEFISRGSVIDMAVGIIVGTSFTAIVNSLVQDVITPAMGLLMGGIDLTTISVTMASPFFTGYDVTIEYGKFMQSIISFFIIAVCVFFMVKAMNIFRRKQTPPPPKVDPQIILLTEIRDALQNGAPVVYEGEQLSFDSVIPLTEENAPSESKSND